MRISEWVSAECPQCGLPAKKAKYRFKHQSSWCVHCKPCTKKANDARKEARQEYHRRKKYGLTKEALAERIAAQSGLCPICRRPFAGEPHVDHDHDTGALRDILCRSCNLLLGLVEDDPTRLRNAAEYLEYHRRGRQAA